MSCIKYLITLKFPKWKPLEAEMWSPCSLRVTAKSENAIDESSCLDEGHPEGQGPKWVVEPRRR